MPNPQLDQFFTNMDRQGLCLTYDDIRLKTRYSEVLPHEADLSGRFSRNIPLRVPIVSSAMDTVTEARMAIAMAENGGLGVIHKNMPPEAQAKEVERVKFHLNGRISRPITVSPDETLADIERKRETKRYKFHSFPVVGSDGKCVGVLTGRDFRYAVNLDVNARAAMKPLAEAVTGSEHTTREKALAVMREAKQSVMPLLREGQVVGMYVYSDLVRICSGTSLHNTDENDHLYAAAAVGAGPDAIARAEHLVAARCNALVIDTAHGYSKNVLWTIAELKRLHPGVDVIAGNVSNGEATKALIKRGADGVLVGQGPGSICTTRMVAGVGCPQVSALYDCARAAVETGSGVPVCADGGIQHPGDIAIALAIGAESVILGSILAGTDKSPGEVIQHGNRQVKLYRGMGSLPAMVDRVESRERYGQGNVVLNKLVPEGVEGLVPFAGPLHDVLNEYAGGIRAGMGYLGARTLQELQERAMLFRITNAGLAESHPHDITTMP